MFLCASIFSSTRRKALNFMLPCTMFIAERRQRNLYYPNNQILVTKNWKQLRMNKWWYFSCNEIALSNFFKRSYWYLQHECISETLCWKKKKNKKSDTHKSVCCVVLFIWSFLKRQNEFWRKERRKQSEQVVFPGVRWR